MIESQGDGEGTYEGRCESWKIGLERRCGWVSIGCGRRWSGCRCGGRRGVLPPVSLTSARSRGFLDGP